jgi:hypothetical protein
VKSARFLVLIHLYYGEGKREQGHSWIYGNNFKNEWVYQVDIYSGTWMCLQSIGLHQNVVKIGLQRGGNVIRIDLSPIQGGPKCAKAVLNLPTWHPFSRAIAKEIACIFGGRILVIL